MTKKDYLVIAQALKNTKPLMTGGSTQSYVLHQWKCSVVAMADGLERENSQFDCNRFYLACQYWV